jgi:hypothetical protein
MSVGSAAIDVKTHLRYQTSELLLANVLSCVGVCASSCRQAFDWMMGFIDTLYTALGTTRNYSATADLHTLQFTAANTLGFSVFTCRILATNL